MRWGEEAWGEGHKTHMISEQVGEIQETERPKHECRQGTREQERVQGEG